jgi:hypothetical protein
MCEDRREENVGTSDAIHNYHPLFSDSGPKPREPVNSHALPVHHQRIFARPPSPALRRQKPEFLFNCCFRNVPVF